MGDRKRKPQIKRRFCVRITVGALFCFVIFRVIKNQAIKTIGS